MLCENHFSPGQNLLREQAHSKFNMLKVIIDLLQALLTDADDEVLELIVAIYDTLIEAVQGPCKKNQEYLALHSQIIDITNRAMRNLFPTCSHSRARYLKQRCTDFLISVIIITF